MADKIIENQESVVDIFELPLLRRDEKGKILVPLSPDLTNLARRISEDETRYLDEFRKRDYTRGFLQIERSEVEHVKKVLMNAGNVVYQSIKGRFPTNKDLENLATYLDWSYQQQVGVTAGDSNQGEATKYGIGALDTWALFTSIKRRLER